MNALSSGQTAMVKANAGDLGGKVDASFQLNWRRLKYEKRLGSGSFGDCYKGYLDKTPAAIKKMRAGECSALKSPSLAFKLRDSRVPPH